MPCWPVERGWFDGSGCAYPRQSGSSGVEAAGLNLERGVQGGVLRGPRVLQGALREAGPHGPLSGASSGSTCVVYDARDKGQVPTLLPVRMGRAQPHGLSDARRGCASAVLAPLQVAVEEPGILLGPQVLRAAVPTRRARGASGARLGVSAPELPGDRF